MIGQNIGKYRVGDRIGRGGMGTVYRAIDETLHREVAIKVLNAELNDPAVARRFHAEAVTVARLNHPGIATIFELFQHEGQWLMVMEFLRGETLEALVTRRGPLPIEEAADLCMQALSALAHAHSLGVVHRDLKPANIMVTEAGVVKIMDFGIARVLGTEHLTSAGFMMGTPAYMAPEQVLAQDIDARADIYAMGVVLFHLVTGKLPFNGTRPFEMARARLQDQPIPVQSLRAEAPGWLGQVIGMALEREVGRRYQSAPAFRDALRRGLANLPQDIPPQSSIPTELVVTAAPGSLPIPTAAVPPPSGTPEPVAVAPAPPTAPMTAPAPIPVPVPVAAPKSAIAEAAPFVLPAAPPRQHRARAVAIVAGVLVMAVVGWTLLRSRHGVLPEAPREQSPAAETPGALVTPPPSPAEPLSSVVPTPPSSTAPQVASATTSEPADAAATAAGDCSTSSPARSGAASAARGRGTVPDSPLTFKDIRLLVVTGRKAEERPALLRFGGGVVAAVAERDGTGLVSMLYRELSYALYARAKDPKWSVALAAPSSDVDLPGGMFRSSRRWLTLQSRVTFLILRLNDADWQQVIDAVTARTGVNVEQPAEKP